MLKSLKMFYDWRVIRPRDFVPAEQRGVRSLAHEVTPHIKYFSVSVLRVRSAPPNPLARFYGLSEKMLNDLLQYASTSMMLATFSKR